MARAVVLVAPVGWHIPLSFFIHIKSRCLVLREYRETEDRTGSKTDAAN